MLEDMLRDISAEGSTEAMVKSLQLDIERLQWKHRQEIAELKHNTGNCLRFVKACKDWDNLILFYCLFN